MLKTYARIVRLPIPGCIVADKGDRDLMRLAVVVQRATDSERRWCGDGGLFRILRFLEGPESALSVRPVDEHSLPGTGLAQDE